MSLESGTPTPTMKMTDTKKNGVGTSAVDGDSGAARAPAPAPTKTLKSQILGGTLTLLAGQGLVGVTNLIYNVATARLLGPKAATDFGLHVVDADVGDHAWLSGGLGQDYVAEKAGRGR